MLIVFSMLGGSFITIIIALIWMCFSNHIKNRDEEIRGLRNRLNRIEVKLSIDNDETYDDDDDDI